MNYLPDGFFLEVDVATHRASTSGSELTIAREMALEKPNTWVQVGPTRRLWKDMSAWCSEVNNGLKKSLRGYTGTFHACWWVEDDIAVDGQKEYGKALIFIKEDA